MHLLLLDLMNWIICAAAAPFRFVLPHRKASYLHVLIPEAALSMDHVLF
jgi:hypothetical protein